MDARALPASRDGCASSASGSRLGARLGPRYRRSREHLLALGQAFAHQPPVAVPMSLVLGALHGLAERRNRRVGPACGGKSLQAGLHRQFDDVDVPLRTKGDTGARGPAQNAANAFHPFLGVRAQRPRDSPFPGGHCYIHARLRLRIVHSPQECGDCGAQYMTKQLPATSY